MGRTAQGLVLLGTLMLPQRKSWRGVVLLAWGLVALTSPAFGILFLLPWGVLVIAVPLVIGILRTLFRNARRDRPA